MIYDYYNIICPKCNHRLIYNIEEDYYYFRSKCICNLIYTYFKQFNELQIYFNGEEFIINYRHSDEEYTMGTEEMYNCFFIDRQNNLFGFKDTIYSFDEAFRCISNVFNLALKIKIKLENNLLFT